MTKQTATATAAAVIAFLVIAAAVYLLSRPRGDVIEAAGFSLAEISPNADGTADLAEFSYSLRRDAVISLYFLDEDGQRFDFRSDEVRTRGDYSVLFSGIVGGFTLPGETVEGEVISRLLPDGDYTWVLEAAEAGTTFRREGQLSVAGGASDLPDLWEFSASPEIFTPNQDGINDRVEINVYVPKPASLAVYLLSPSGQQIFIPAFEQGRAPGEAGRHSFEYDGGIDNGSNPPPDGAYTIFAEAEDAEGQRVIRESVLQIADGGVPLAEIVGQPGGDTVRYSSETIIVGDVLTFELTVENYGDAPIRTTGPAPGYIYEQDERFSTSGYFEESGAWRVGLHCDTCLTDYPWRWALGTPETLTAVESSSGETHYYLMPGQRAVITGGVRLTNIVESRNPQQFWAGLIHEDVGIAPLNNRVDPRFIEIVEAP